LLLDLPVEAGLERVKKRSGPAPTDRFEEEPARFFERVREAYLELARAAPGRIRIINAAGTVEEVQKAVTAVLESLGA
jgi:dTMP kinase